MANFRNVLPSLVVLTAVSACSSEPSRFGNFTPSDGSARGMDATMQDAMPDTNVYTVDTPAVPDVDCGGRIVGTCPTPHPDGCMDRELPNNGADDNCNGQVDEGSACVPGAVQRCFAGPPGRRGVGACTDGMQTCQGTGEFGTWGPCAGGITPHTEVCDSLDNDCNGCADEALCCSGGGTCPGPDDPRVPVGRPFEDYRLMGRMFYPGMGTARWHWRVVGGPCDQMLFATSHSLSYTLNGGRANRTEVEATDDMFVFHPTLSGDYQVTLTVIPDAGEMFTCTFIIRVRAPGFRVELCWDTTGTDDIDLWTHDPRTPSDWAADTDTCYYANCRNRDTDRPDWGYADVSGVTCREPDRGACHSPRLDIDNIDTVGVPENINVDDPRDGDTFRVAVNYYGGDDHTVRPMVNIYCGGALRATYGGADVGGMHVGSAPVDGFDTSGDDSSGSVWRVVDVTVHEPADGCDLRPLHPHGTSSGYCVDTSDDRSFDGPCAR